MCIQSAQFFSAYIKLDIFLCEYSSFQGSNLSLYSLVTCSISVFVFVVVHRNLWNKRNQLPYLGSVWRPYMERRHHSLPPLPPILSPSSPNILFFLFSPASIQLRFLFPNIPIFLMWSLPYLYCFLTLHSLRSVLFLLYNTCLDISAPIPFLFFLILFILLPLSHHPLHFSFSPFPHISPNFFPLLSGLSIVIISFANKIHRPHLPS